MEIENTTRLMSVDGMTMIYLKELVIEGGNGKQRESHQSVKFIERRGKFLKLHDLEFPLNTKEDIAWFLELCEMIEQVAQKLRGY